MTFKQFQAIILSSCLLFVAQINYNAPDLMPSSFKLERQGNGVQLYKRIDRNGYPELLQVVNLQAGARVVLLAESPINGRQKLPDPTFQRNLLTVIWKRFRAQYPHAFSLSSGAFFGWYTQTTARLPFPLKINNQIKTYGYGEDQYDQWLLALYKKNAVIKPYKRSSNIPSSLARAANIVVGLGPRCNKDGLGDQSVGRTYIAVKDSPIGGTTRGDGIYETVLIYQGNCTEKQAYHALKSCGGAQIMMLCGGPVAQLVCQGKFYKLTEEKLPQTIGVIEATSYAVE
ncbi:MAG: hypothetical protein AB8E82_17610 [Aureispira sp.]